MQKMLNKKYQRRSLLDLPLSAQQGGNNSDLAHISNTVRVCRVHIGEQQNTQDLLISDNILPKAPRNTTSYTSWIELKKVRFLSSVVMNRVFPGVTISFNSSIISLASILVIGNCN